MRYLKKTFKKDIIKRDTIKSDKKLDTKAIRLKKEVNQLYPGGTTEWKSH